MSSALGLLVLVCLMCLLVVKYGNVLLALLFKLAAFIACLWVAMQMRACLAQVLMDYGWVQTPALANIVGFVAILLACMTFFRAMVDRVRSGKVGKVEGAMLDSARIGLVVIVVLLCLVTLLGLVVGQVIDVSALWIAIVAAIAAIIDESSHTLLSNVAAVNRK